jgi:hypothetical protein
MANNMPFAGQNGRAPKNSLDHLIRQRQRRKKNRDRGQRFEIQNGHAKIKKNRARHQPIVKYALTHPGFNQRFRMSPEIRAYPSFFLSPAVPY